MPISPNEAKLRGRIGGYRLAATHNSRETTSAARAAFARKFETSVDPDGILPEAERARRAEAARRAHMAELAYRSARARSRRTLKAPDQSDRDGDNR